MFTPPPTTVIARLDAANEDGQAVIVTEICMPARFYTIKIEASGDKPAVTMSTGSGDACRRLALDIAQAVSDGMLGVRLSDAENQVHR